MKIKEYARKNCTLKESYDRVSAAWILNSQLGTRTESLMLIAEAIRKPGAKEQMRVF